MTESTVEYITTNYGNFSVSSVKDNFSFFHIHISDEKLFFQGLCEFILSEGNLLKYAENKSAIRFEPTKKNYVTLYKQLYNFIDSENMVPIDASTDIADVLIDEFEEIFNEDGENFIRLSKIGRLGEYIFHIFLSDYFKFDCIIPKIKLTTDRNMSVYGIDVLFLDKEHKMILFGESKVTKKIDNGISMVNKSLENYEDEIREEFMLVLSNNHLKLNGLDEVFPGEIEACITFDEFLERTETKYIGVPIFIAHGTETDVELILKKLRDNIKRLNYFGLKTVYFVISLPIQNKQRFFHYITQIIRRKMEEYNGS